MSQQSHKIS